MALTCQNYWPKIGIMTDAEHEERLRKTRAETEEIRQQIMQLEFQDKKDVVEMDRDFKERDARIQIQLDHLIKVVGITYEELDNLDFKLQETGRYLIQPRKHSIIS